MKNIFITALVLLVGSGCQANSNDDAGTAQKLESVEPGTFISIGNHQVEGSARLESRADGVYLVLEEDFMTVSGPDLRLVLRDSSNQKPMEVIAMLTAFQGLQEYKLSLSEEALQELDQVVVYCAKFHVDFGIAKLK